MRILVSLFLSPLFAAAVPLPDGKAWASGQAARSAQPPGFVALPEPITDDVIRFVGPRPGGGALDAAQCLVFAVAIPDPTGGASDATSVAADQTIPAGAHWPDARYRIAVDPAEIGNPQGRDELRNPWEVRVHPKSSAEETVLDCGGIIGGGEYGSVAFLNGHVLRQGDTLGKFSVARVLANEVVLERNASYIVIPRGTRVTVTSVVH